MMTGYPDLTTEEYSRKITWLLIIYQKIIKVLQEEKEDVDEKLKGILRRIEATEAIDRITGEEMDLETQRMSLQERINLCLDAQTTTNNTAVINLFHFWERYWFDVIRAIELKPDATDEDIKKFKYKDFETFAGIKHRIEKYRTVSDSVSLVNNIVNILKHANRRKITVLQEVRPDLFPTPTKYNRINVAFLINIQGSDALCLKPEHVKEMFDILAGNGPDASIIMTRIREVERSQTDALQGLSK